MTETGAGVRWGRARMNDIREAEREGMTELTQGRESGAGLRGMVHASMLRPKQVVASRRERDAEGECEVETKRKRARKTREEERGIDRER